MFYFLMALGLVLNGAGIYAIRYKEKSGDPFEIQSEGEPSMEQRVSALEDYLFANTMESTSLDEGSDEDNPVIADSLKRKLDRLIEFEEKGDSLEKLSKSLRMKRGEVLLLKGLLRNYQK